MNFDHLCLHQQARSYLVQFGLQHATRRAGRIIYLLETSSSASLSLGRIDPVEVSQLGPDETLRVLLRKSGLTFEEVVAALCTGKVALVENRLPQGQFQFRLVGTEGGLVSLERSSHRYTSLLGSETLMEPPVRHLRRPFLSRLFLRLSVYFRRRSREHRKRSLDENHTPGPLRTFDPDQNDH